MTARTRNALIGLARVLGILLLLAGLFLPVAGLFAMFLPWGFVAMNKSIAIYVLICFALPIVLIPLSLMLINAPMFLESKKVSICRHCGYDLRGSRGATLCSECGRNPWAEQP